MDIKLRPGDVVLVTARVKHVLNDLTQDGTVYLEPLGFEVDFRGEEVYTLDPPHEVLVRSLYEGDEVSWVTEDDHRVAKHVGVVVQDLTGMPGKVLVLVGGATPHVVERGDLTITKQA